MNVENILALAELLESDAAQMHFDMTSFFSVEHESFRKADGYIDHENYSAATDALEADPVSAINNCGSTACMAGWEVVRLKLKPDNTGMAVFAIARQSLGISLAQANNLFLPDHNRDVVAFSRVARATPKQAAKVLRHLAAKGRVDWRAAFKGAA